MLIRSGVIVGAALVWSAAVARAEHVRAIDARTRELQSLVDSLRERLGIRAAVSLAIVDKDVRTLSVRRAADGTFALAAEREFMETLTREQVEAALAHELGHVWIYLNHPHLQTEQLANRVAMRAVSRERLVEVYQVLWGADALHGSLETFLGVETIASK